LIFAALTARLEAAPFQNTPFQDKYVDQALSKHWRRPRASKTVASTEPVQNIASTEFFSKLLYKP
jgi:hypothetical protein